MAFDGSPQAVRTFPVARTISRMLEGSLHLVVSAEAGGGRQRLPPLDDPIAEATRHELMGDPAVGIVQLATFSADAIIVTPAYGGNRPRSGLDPGPEEILRRSPCPVLVVQPSVECSAWSLRRILVPQDGTADAARALCPVARLAKRSGAEVLILHVTPDRSSGAPEPGAMEVPAYVDQPQHEWPSWVAVFLERIRHLCRMSPELMMRFHWARGDTAREIIAAARQRSADLVTILRQPQDPGRERILRRILREAPCPVLVLPASR
jgi:nucleotide-binding universal stress UspA family protein